MNTSVTLSNILVKRRFCTVLQIDRLHIPFGQFIGVIGPNGAGKTTLLKLCCGLIKPTHGRVERNCLRVGYIPQQTEYNAHLPFTLREIVAMGCSGSRRLGRRLKRTDYENVDFWITRMGLYDRRNQSFRSLSGGQQQKTLIARAMVAKPDFVLMDEPGANLDPAWKRQLKHLLEDLFDPTQMSILLISHDLELIPACCERLILLDNGQIAADGPAATVFETAAARQTFDLLPGGSEQEPRHG